MDRTFDRLTTDELTALRTIIRSGIRSTRFLPDDVYSPGMVCDLISLRDELELVQLTGWRRGA